MEYCKLAYDESKPSGPKQNFFHYLWGYLMPAILFIHKKGAADHYIFHSCGPVMDEMASSFMNHLQLKFDILSQKAFDELQGTAILLDRLDSTLLFARVSPLSANLIPVMGLKEKYEAFKQRIKWLTNRERQKQYANATRSLNEIRQLVFNLLEDDLINPTKYKDKIIILQRAEEPEFYSEKGKSIEKGYGKSRRHLKNVNRFIELHANYRLITYTPGNDNLVEQIKVFSQSAGIIAIRGAEIANLAWVRPGCKIVIFRNQEYPYPSEHIHALSRQFKFQFSEIYTNVKRYPDLLNYKFSDLKI